MVWLVVVIVLMVEVERPKKSRRNGSYSNLSRFMNMVREALVATMTKTPATWLPLRLYTSEVSTVPKARVPLSKASHTRSSLASSQRSLEAEE